MWDGRRLNPTTADESEGKKREKEKTKMNEKSEWSGNPEEKWKDGGAGGGC